VEIAFHAHNLVPDNYALSAVLPHKRLSIRRFGEVAISRFVIERRHAILRDSFLETAIAHHTRDGI